MRALPTIILMACMISGIAAGASAAAADDTLVRRFSTGTGIGDVGVAESTGGEDREDDGPQALTSDQAGKLFLLDQLNDRILTFEPGSPASAPQALALPTDVHATDIVVDKSAIYAWDGHVHALQALGPSEATTRGLAETRAGEPVGDATTTAFAQMGSVPGDDDDQPGVSTRGTATRKPPALNRQFVDTRGRGPLVVDITITDHGTGAQLDVRRKADLAPIAPRLVLRVTGRVGTVAFLSADDSGRMFVLAESIPENVQDASYAFVARYGVKGALEGIYELPLGSTTSVSRRSVTVSPEGDVYFLKADRKTVDVVGIGFRATPNVKIIALGQPKLTIPALGFPTAPWVGMAVGPLTRQKVLQTAVGFEGLRWTVASANYGPQADASCSGFNGRIRRPGYLIGKEGQPVQGVPYCWGCQGSLPQFAAKVQQGALAGNVCTRDGVRSDVVGVDCSSFVSAAWGLSTHFATTAIPAISQQLSNPWDLKPGDALNKPGSHVVLFLGFTADRQARVMEASPGACNGRVCRNTYPLSSLLARGFLPVRYRALVDGTESATQPSAAGSVAQ